MLVTMKFFLVFILPLAFSQEDPPPAKEDCPPPGKHPMLEQFDPETEIICPGFKDARTGCQGPTFSTWKWDLYDQKDLDGNLCPNFCPPNCDWAREIRCPKPMVNGCHNQQGYCIPESKDENGCPVRCPMENACDEESGQALCPGGIDPADGCPLGDYCAQPSTHWETGAYCPGRCSSHCNEDAGEKWCNKGRDENGCWLGDYCATECTENN